MIWHKLRESTRIQFSYFYAKYQPLGYIYRIKEIIMRSRTTNRVHTTSLSYRETIAAQTAKKNRECASVRMNNYSRFAFVVLLTEEFLRGSTNHRDIDSLRQFSVFYCFSCHRILCPSYKFDKDSLTSFRKQHKTSGKTIVSSGKKKLYASGSRLRS